MTKKQYRMPNVNVGTVKKSIAAMASRWFRRNRLWNSRVPEGSQGGGDQGPWIGWDGLPQQRRKGSTFPAADSGSLCAACHGHERTADHTRDGCRQRCRGGGDREEAGTHGGGKKAGERE